MASRRARTAFAPRIIAAAVASCFSSQPAFANPTGPQVVNGAVGFARPNASTLNVTNSPGSIINWQGFSIGASEITRFIQQSASSAVLNRVVGGNISQIQGQLLSNGRVFLINPSGIVVGPGAVIDTAGFVGSTLNMLDADFLAGKLKFQGDGTSGSIINQGWIRTASGGQVILVAPQIENSGLIHTPGGEIILAAGKSLTIASLDHEGVQFQIQAPADSVINVGKLLAEGGVIGVFAGTLKHSGDIRATSLSTDATGRIVLRASGNIELAAGSVTSASGVAGGKVQIQSGDTTLVAGTVEATGSTSSTPSQTVSPPPQGEGEGGGGFGRGGTIHILGNKVGLIDAARVDASGDTGGGAVLVGGDFQGTNPAVQNAYRTYFGPDATIRSDALVSGNGGKVILWSDDATRAYGSITARGGSQSGNGGLVEVSGKQFLDFSGLVNTTAPSGATGHLLLDPADLTITTTADAFNGGSFTGGVFGGPTSPATITWSTIDTQLAGNNVVITTAGTAVGNLGNITVANASPTLNRANALWLVANNDINVNGAITNIGTGDVALYSGWNGGAFTFPTAPVVTSGVGTITVNQSVVTKGLELKFVAGKDISIANGVTIENAPSTPDGSKVTMQAVGGSINSAAGGAITNIRALAGSPGGPHDAEVAFAAGTGITLNNTAVTATGFGSSALATISLNGGSVSLNSTTLSATGGNGADIGGTATVTLTATTGDIAVNSGTISAMGGNATSAGAANITLKANAGNVTATSTTITATAGSGSTSTGPSATVTLQADGGSLAVSSSTISATGGGATDGTAGAATVMLMASPGGVTINSSTITATGGGGINGTAGAATMQIQAGTTIAVSDSTIIANGGDMQDVGGAATVTLTATNGGITLNNSSIAANGGAGPQESGGAATINVTGTRIELNNSTASATGGDGSTNVSATPDATVTFTATSGDIWLRNGSAITATGGASTACCEAGAATVTLNAQTGIQVDNSTVSATGGGGGSAYTGGAASVTFTTSGGGIVLNTSTISAAGGNGTSTGGAATATFSAAAGVSLTSSSISATGGDGSDGGTALVTITGASITLDASPITVTAGNGSGFAGATANMQLTASGGNVSLIGSNLTSSGGGATTMDGAASIDIISQAGAIVQSGAGQLEVNSPNSNASRAIDLQARDGIGATGAPVRVVGGFSSLNANNASLWSPGSGNIVLSQTTLGVDLGLYAVTNGATGGGVDIKGESGAITVPAMGFSNVNGPITFRADSMDILGSVAAQGGTGSISLQTVTAGRPIELGTIGDAVAALALSGAELSNLSAGTITIGEATGNPTTITGNITLPASLSLASLAGTGNIALGGFSLTAGLDNSSTTYSGVISGTAGLTKAGTGTLTLSGANTYTGTTTVNAGTLALNGGAAIADTGAVNLSTSGATLTLGVGETIGSLTAVAGTTVALGGNTLTVGDGGSTTFAGVMGGTGGLTKVGAGTLTLSGANTYTGATTVNAGTVALGAGSVLADGSSVVVSGGVLDMGAFNDTVSGVQLVSGTITGGGGVLTSQSAYDMQSGTVSAILGGTVGLNKGTAGTLTLSGANTYTGTTTVNAGTLQLNGGAAIVDTGAVNLAASGAALSLGASETIGSLTGVAGTTVALGGNTLTVGDATSPTFAGVMGGTGGLAKQGAGTLTLSGANTYTGTTTVNAGTLALTGGSLSGPLVNLSTVDLNGATIAGLFTNSGTANVTGSSTASGGVQQSGTLNLGGGQTLTVGGAGFDWQGGTLAGTGGLSVSGASPFTITTGATHTLNGPTLSVEDLDLTGGNLALLSGTVNVLTSINVGSGTTLASQGATINAPGATMNVSGIFQAGAGSVMVGSTNILAGGLLKGTGTLASNVTNNGTLAPGASPGILTISGDYAQGPSGVLAMEIGGTTPGAQFDQLVVTGTATLGGALNVSLINGFSPLPTDFFSLIQAGSVSGVFASTNFPSGSFLAPTYLPTSFVVSAPPTGQASPGATASVLVEDQTLRDAVRDGPASPEDEAEKLAAPICS